VSSTQSGPALCDPCPSGQARGPTGTPIRLPPPSSPRWAARPPPRRRRRTRSPAAG